MQSVAQEAGLRPSAPLASVRVVESTLQNTLLQPVTPTPVRALTPTYA